MISSPDTATKAARLIYKALQRGTGPKTDLEYRDLLSTYRAEPEFQRLVFQIASGLELQVLDVTERGVIIAPTGPDSRFAYRLSDIRSAAMSEGEKCSLVLAHVSIASVFFPTTEFLDDDERIPPPASLSQFRDSLYQLSRHLQSASTADQSSFEELRPGWEYIARSTVAIPGKSRAALSSIDGIVKLATNSLRDGGLINVHLASEDESMTTYTPTFRLRVQLREFSLRRLYELARQTISV